MLTRAELIKRCAEASGISPGRAADVWQVIVGTIASRLRAGERVVVDGFGVFIPPRKILPSFRPLPPLLERIALQPTVQPNLEATVDVEDNGYEMIRLMPAPVRPEDSALIERWLATRRGSQTPAPVAGLGDPLVEVEAELTEARKVLRYWSDETIRRARSILRAYARRCVVPIAQVGFNQPAGKVPREIVMYALDYKRRALPRLAKLNRDGVRGPDWRRTQGWFYFLTWGQQFYQWLEAVGIRPVGSNPLQGVVRRSPIDFSADIVMIVTSWYSSILRFPGLAPREKALIYLLANGLRASEAASVSLTRMSLSEQTVEVTSKGVTRSVRLLPWVITAVDDWLRRRSSNPSPWLFPGAGAHGHISTDRVREMVKAAAERVFYDQADSWIVERIHPHGFRHYYVTEFLEHGGLPEEAMAQTGHRSRKMLGRYVSVDEERLKKAVERVSRKRWF